jgi:hypothetical protein
LSGGEAITPNQKNEAPKFLGISVFSLSFNEYDFKKKNH